MTHNLFLSILLHRGGLVSLASERASTVFSELVSYFCLRFRVEPVPSAHRGCVQWWHKLYCQFFFSAGNVFFERNRKIPLCFFIFPEGPRVTEVTKLKILSQLEDWEYTTVPGSTWYSTTGAPVLFIPGTRYLVLYTVVHYIQYIHTHNIS